MSTLLGKIVRLDAQARAAVIVAAGVRNPWRFSFDRKNGDLYIGDVGQGAIEEVDWVAWPWRGLLNFGWDVYEGRAKFEDKALGPGRLVQPVSQYTHGDGCSISGGYVYRGKAVPAAAGRYFYGDYCSGTVWSLKMVSGKARQIRREPFSVESLTAFGEDAAGELYLVSHAGMLYRLAG
jgi:glucose/arabinose dehydrogenase